MSVRSFKRDRPTIGILTGRSIIHATLSDYYRAVILHGIQSAARVRQCNIIVSWGIRVDVEANDIYPTWPVVSSKSDFIPVGPWNMDGLIVFTPLGNEGRSLYLQKLLNEGFPILFVATGEQGPTISVDNAIGIRQAMAHLVEHGHRRIAFLAGDPTDKGDSQSRLLAYCAAVAEFGLEADPQLIEWGWHVSTDGYKAMQTLLRSGVKFTAVMASNDNSAIGAMQAIREAGLRIPRDIAIIGFDDQSNAVAQVPSLSSLHVPLNLIGEQALALMDDHLKGHAVLESVQISPRLVKRQSCGCKPEMVSSTTSGTSSSIIDQTRRSAKPSLQELQQQLVNKMLVVLPTELRVSDREQIQQTCTILVKAIYTALGKNNPTYFQTMFMESIYELELADSKIDCWQEMISILRREMMQLHLVWSQERTRILAEDIFDQVRVVVAESTQRQDYRRQYQQDSHARALNSLTAQLSAVLSEREIADLLNLHLAKMGIGHGRVMLFESQDNDPVAWSVVLDAQASNQRFPSRQFPPEGLYPPGDLFNIILLPLVFQGEVLGYCAFEATKLESCAVIALQLATTIKVSRLHEQIVELSLTDPLTGLHNRRYFDLFLASEIARWHRAPHNLSIIMVDIDHFKDYNDQFGHLAGDQALRQVADCLTTGCRATDVVTRIGGEEFAIILTETEINGALVCAEKLRITIADNTDFKQQITVSLGVTELSEQILEAEVLLDQADRALYEAKRKGRDRVCVYRIDVT